MNCVLFRDGLDQRVITFDSSDKDTDSMKVAFRRFLDESQKLCCNIDVCLPNAAFSLSILTDSLIMVECRMSGSAQVSRSTAAVRTQDADWRAQVESLIHYSPARRAVSALLEEWNEGSSKV